MHKILRHVYMGLVSVRSRAMNVPCTHKRQNNNVCNCDTCALAKLKKASKGQGILVMHMLIDYYTGSCCPVTCVIFVVNKPTLTGVMYTAIFSCPFSQKIFVKGITTSRESPRSTT